MRTLLLSILFILGNTSAAFACIDGEARMGNGDIGFSAIIICQKDGYNYRYKPTLQRSKWLSFFTEFQDDAEFIEQSVATFEMQYSSILEYFEKSMDARIEVHSDNIRGLEYLANKYSSWSGATQVADQLEQDKKVTSIKTNGFIDLVHENVKAIKKTQEQEGCENIGETFTNKASAMRLLFTDTEVLNIFPVNLEKIGEDSEDIQGSYRFSYLRSQVDQLFYYDTEVQVRKIVISDSSMIDWHAPDGRVYQIDSGIGLGAYESFSTFSGRTNDLCEINKMTSQVEY